MTLVNTMGIHLGMYRISQSQKLIVYIIKLAFIFYVPFNYCQPMRNIKFEMYSDILSISEESSYWIYYPSDKLIGIANPEAKKN